MKVLILFSLFASIWSLSTAYSSYKLQFCFDKLKQLNITAKPVTYQQLVDLGALYGQLYCRVETNDRHPYTCDYIRFNPKTKSEDPGLVSVSLQFSYTFFSLSTNFLVYDTATPGVFTLAEQITGSNARLMAILEAQPGILVYYLCSADIFEYNDFRVNSAEQKTNVSDLRPIVESRVTSPTCHYFETDRKSCAKFNIPLTLPNIFKRFKNYLG